MKRLTIGLFFVMMLSCNKYVQVTTPPNQLTNATVFSDDNSAKAALSGIYSHMLESPGDFAGQLPILTGLYADELTNFSTDPRQIQFYLNSVNASNTLMGTVWANLYKYIYETNSGIEGLNASANISGTVKQLLLGEAKFVRAFCYFYLVNLFGDVPLVTSTDFAANAVLSRSNQSVVFNQIIKDLSDAEDLMLADYSYSGEERLRPMKWAATALLARVYLFQKNWTLAEEKSTEVIDQTALYSLDILGNVFKKNSMEAIWQIEPVSPGYNTWDGFNFILYTPPTNVALNNVYIEDFELNDNRRTIWIDSLLDQGVIYYFPNKYNIKTGDELSEYQVVLRLAEQYLIRAESRAQLDENTAIDDLNFIRQRAGLDSYAGPIDRASILESIYHERKTELFCEWGHRWLDLKRTQRANATLSLIKPGWKITDTLLPILQTDILNDPNLAQNPGY